MHRFHSSNEIHPTAIVGDQVVMGQGNRIGPNCILDGKVCIGDDNVFDASIVTHHQVTIGSHCRFYPFVALGFPGEMGAKGDKLPDGAGVEIGDMVVLREFVNVHAPYWWESTRISDSAYIMNKAYLAHDVQIGKSAIINAGVCLGGRAIVGDFANIGMNATVHQRSVVGENAMVGMGAGVKRNIPPFSVVVGLPAKVLKFNRVGAERRGLEELDWVEINFEAILRGIISSEHPVAVAISSFFEKYPEALRG
jgi:UDP-N-acetylglucosamine acyltransferase